MAACASVYALCGGMELHEEDITRWLRRVGALRAPGQAAAPSGAPATDNSSSEVAASRNLMLMHGVELRA